MRKILTSRLFRFLACLVLICSLLINVSPIKARADVVSGGLVAAGATGAVVSVPVAIAIGATLIALGIIADAASQNPYALQKLASDVGDALAAAGTYVKDGMVEMYRFVTDTGEAVYYAAADFMEEVRSWLFNPETGDPVVSTLSYGFNEVQQSNIASTIGKWVSSYGCSPYIVICGTADPATDFYGNLLISQYPLIYESDGYYRSYNDKGYVQAFNVYRIYSTSVKGLSSGLQSKFSAPERGYHAYSDTSLLFTPYDLTLGYVPTVPIDGTSARAWSDVYANRGLYIASGGSQNPDDGGEGNDGWKFLLPLAFLAGADLWAMSQADQWTGSTPPEFGDYSTEEELTVTPAPEFDGYQAIEIAPAPNTNPDPGTGTNPDPGTGTNPDPGTGTNPDPGTGTDPGTDSGTSSWTPPSDMGKFTLDLKQYFPFCIPFDLYAFFTCLNAEPVAPVIEWIIPLPGGKAYPFEIDLSAFDSVAQILRRMQLLLFCVGLAFKTRDLIKG